MFGAIAGGIASALAGGAMSKLFGGGQKAASGGIQGDVLATDNNTVDRKSGSAGMPRPISYAVFCLKKKKKTKQQPPRLRRQRHKQEYYLRTEPGLPDTGDRATELAPVPTI